MPDFSQILSDQYTNLQLLTGDLLLGRYGDGTKPQYSPGLKSFAPDSSIFSAVDPNTGGLFTANAKFNTNPNLYELDRVAAQSTFSSMWNDLWRGINETQKSQGQLSFFNAANRIAEIEGDINSPGELRELEEQKNKIGEPDYLKRKAKITDELRQAYKDLEKSKKDIYEDEQDLLKYPVKKSYKRKSELIQSMGSDADFIDQYIYTWPENAGSSAATILSTTTAQLVGNAVKKQVARTAATWLAGPAAGTLANVAGITAGALEVLYARLLESKAEVGGQIASDFEELKTKYLQDTGKQDLTKEEFNYLVREAHKGSEAQMRKNISLSFIDGAQTMLLWGANKYLPSSLRKLANYNKATRAGSSALNLYTQGKLESIEEGLQYGFGQRKSELSLGTGDPDYYKQSWIEQLRQDTGDVLGSIDFGIFKGNGRYSGNKQFEFATEAGFMMGVIMGGAGTSFRTATDIYNYRRAAKDIKKYQLDDVEGNINRFEAQVLKEFFEPKTKGTIRGTFLNADTSDRVFYLKQALKSLTKTKDETGAPMLSKEAYSEMLSKIDRAADAYQKVNNHLDNIYRGFGEDRTLFNFRKEIFRNVFYENYFRLGERKKDLSESLGEHSLAMGTVDVDAGLAIDYENKLSIIDELSASAGENQKRVLKDLKKKYKDLLEAQQVLLGGKQIPQPSIELNQANRNLIKNELHLGVTSNLVNEALKVKTKQGLKDWLKTFAKDASLPDQELNVTKELEYRTEDFSKLSDEDKESRKTRNRDLAQTLGFTDQFTQGLSDLDLDSLLKEELSDRLRNEVGFDDARSEIFASNVKDAQELKDKLAESKKFAKWFNKTFKIKPDVLTDVDLIKIKETARILAKERQKKENRVKNRIEGFIATQQKKVTGRKKSQDDQRSVKDLQGQFNVKAGKASEVDVLQGIITSPFATESEKKIAYELIKLSSPDSFITFKNTDQPGVAGEYDTVTKEVTIDLRYLADDYENVDTSAESAILHELIHKRTYDELQKNDKLSRRLSALFSEIKRAAKEKGLDNYFYGLNNEYDLLSEGLVSEEFQKILKDIELSDEYQKSYEPAQNAFEGFIDLIKTILEALGIKPERTALKEVLDLAALTIGPQQVTNDVLVETALNLYETKLNELASKIPLDIKLHDLYTTMSGLSAKVLGTKEIKNLLKNKEVVNRFMEAYPDIALEITSKLSSERSIQFGNETYYKGQPITIKSKKQNRYIAVTVQGVEVVDENSYKLRVYVPDSSGKLVIRSILDPQDVVGKFKTTAQAQEYANKLNESTSDGGTYEKPEIDYDDYELKAGAVFKTINQPFLDAAQKTPNENKSYKLYKQFVDNVAGQPENLSDLGYFGLLVLDSTNPISFPDGNFYSLPHDEVTLENIKKGKGKFSPVIVLVDKSGTPVKLDDSGNKSDTGAILVLNIESAKTLNDRLNDPETLAAIARRYGLFVGDNPDTASAKEMFKESIEKLEKTRKEVAGGKIQYLVEFTDISKGIPVKTKEQNDTISNLEVTNFEVGYVDKSFNETSPVGPMLTSTGPTSFKGLVGGTYLLNWGFPIKINPKNITEEEVNEIIKLLDFSDKLNEASQDEIYKYIRSVYYFPAHVRFAGKSIIVGQGEEAKRLTLDDRKEILLKSRVNLRPNLFNTNIKTFSVTNGQLSTGTLNYNDFVIKNVTTNVQFNLKGPEVINRYLAYTFGNSFNTKEAPKVSTPPPGAPSPTIDIEAKKADIERRRQEVLKGKIRSDKVLSDNYENYENEIKDMNSAIFKNLENADLIYKYYEIKELPIESLDISKKTEGYSGNASDYLKEELKETKNQKTPILINGRGEVVEGWHRIHSLKANGQKIIKAYVPVKEDIDAELAALEQPAEQAPNEVKSAEEKYISKLKNRKLRLEIEVNQSPESLISTLLAQNQIKKTCE